MNLPRFSLLQLLGVMTLCGLLFSLAAIDGWGAAIVFLVFAASLVAALVTFAVFYFFSQWIVRISGPGKAAGRSGHRLAPAGGPAPPPDLAATVQVLRGETSASETPDSEGVEQ